MKVKYKKKNAFILPDKDDQKEKKTGRSFIYSLIFVTVYHAAHV